MGSIQLFEYFGEIRRTSKPLSLNSAFLIFLWVIALGKDLSFVPGCAFKLL